MTPGWLGHRRACFAACIRLLRTKPKAFLGTLVPLVYCLLRDVCGAYRCPPEDHTYVLLEFVSYTTLMCCVASATAQFEPTLKICIALAPNWLVRHLPTAELCPKFRHL
jgi:hypothetical protein